VLNGRTALAGHGSYMPSYDPRVIDAAPADKRLDSYLNIAEAVLVRARRPLSPREILRQAYNDELVPSHLFGKTQHKTLGARLSEDILLRRDRSAFFRTNPGYFFLRKFLADASLPERYRTPIVARRRERELERGAALCFSPEDISDASATDFTISVKFVLKLLRSNRFNYAGGKDRTPEEIIVWSFVVIVRNTKILTYRIGRYRDGRDSFTQKRSIGFFRPICETDRTLFDLKDHGIVSSGVRAASIDLDFPQNVMGEEEYRARSDLSCFLVHKSISGVTNLLALIRFECPDWFEPTKRRLAINDLQWLDLRTPINYIEDFDPWSQLALSKLTEHLRRHVARG
jgi:HB1, ASXL, restriction endonuclease HTH domain